VFWTQGNPATAVDGALTVTDSGSTTLTGATVTISSGFLAGDQLNFTNQNGITGSYNAATGVLTLSGASSVANYQTALDSVSYSSTSSSPSAAGADSVRTITWQAANGSATSNMVTSTGQIYQLTTGIVTIHAGAGNDIIIATNNTLKPGDVIDGGGGANTLELQGGGIFNLQAPTTLTDIQTVTAQESQTQLQFVFLRNGFNNVAVNVSADTSLNPKNPIPPTVFIFGANNNDTINLASGDDIVDLGSASEKVNLGSGNDFVFATASTIGATIGGGAGAGNSLVVTGGGTMTMGANIADISEALLLPGAKPYDFTANAISGLTVDDLSSGGLSFLGSLASEASALGTFPAGTSSDTIQAGAGDQTLTGGSAGKLTMNAANYADVLLKDTARLFTGDTAENLVNGDMIDITGLGFSAAHTSLGFAFNKASDTTTMSVLVSGTQKTAITLLGQYMASDFSVSADTAGTGTLITLIHELNLAMPH